MNDIERLEASVGSWRKEAHHHIQLNAGLRLKNSDLIGYANVLRSENDHLRAENVKLRDAAKKSGEAARISDPMLAKAIHDSDVRYHEVFGSAYPGVGSKA